MKFLRASATALVVTCALVACSRSKTDSSATTQPQALAIDAGVAAAPADSSGQPFGDHTPPPMMFDACNGKNDGDPCQVTIRDHDITGLCGAPRPGSTETRLFCHARPTFFGNRPRHGNPVMGNPQIPVLPNQPPGTPSAHPAAQ